jgi:hypothetical protein
MPFPHLFPESLSLPAATTSKNKAASGVIEKRTGHHPYGSARTRRLTFEVIPHSREMHGAVLVLRAQTCEER